MTPSENVALRMPPPDSASARHPGTAWPPSGTPRRSRRRAMRALSIAIASASAPGAGGVEEVLSLTAVSD
jgi:hypothetical protein